MQMMDRRAHLESPRKTTVWKLAQAYMAVSNESVDRKGSDAPAKALGSHIAFQDSGKFMARGKLFMSGGKMGWVSDQGKPKPN